MHLTPMHASSPPTCVVVESEGTSSSRRLQKPLDLRQQQQQYRDVPSGLWHLCLLACCLCGCLSLAHSVHAPIPGADALRQQ
jgi:hypothetical protein